MNTQADYDRLIRAAARVIAADEISGKHGIPTAIAADVFGRLRRLVESRLDRSQLRAIEDEMHRRITRFRSR